MSLVFILNGEELQLEIYVELTEEFFRKVGRLAIILRPFHLRNSSVL